MLIGVVAQPRGILAWMIKSLSIVGPGRVGRALGRPVKETGWQIVSSRHVRKERETRSAIHWGRTRGGGSSCDCCGSVHHFLAVPDDEIGTVACGISQSRW